MKTSRFRRVTVAPFLGLLCAAASCTTTTAPRLVPFPEPAASGARPEGRIDGYPSALAAILWATEHELSIPRLAGSLRLYSGHTSLEAALLGEGFDALYARQMANTVDGVGRPGTVLVNEAALRSRSWPERVAFLAHELAHVAEYELAGGRRGNLDQWLREGLAELVSWQVMETLQLGTLAERRRAAEATVRAAAARRELPPFEELLTPGTWASLRGDGRRSVLYDEAFLATDQLVARHGLPAALAYFRNVGVSDDHLGNFREAFGEERAGFQAAFGAYLATLVE